MDDVERVILDERIRQIGSRFYEKDFHFSNNSEMDILMMLPYLCEMTIRQRTLCFVIVCDDSSLRTIAHGKVNCYPTWNDVFDFLWCY